MADFPSSIYSQRATENLPGVTYDATKKTQFFAEDLQGLGDEVTAIESTLGTEPQGVYATVRAWLDALTAAISSLVTAFTDLSDVPSSYAGAGGKAVAVKSDESGLEFVSFPAGAGAPTGSIFQWPTTSAPSGYVICDGTSYLRSGTMAALFAVIGTTFGSADGTHFNVPDIRGRVPVGKNSATFSTIGNTGGEETHLLTVAEIPDHHHTLYNGTGSGSAKPTNSRNANSGSANFVTDESNAGGGSHNNLQPYIVLNYIIKI
jgi:microcystin-dependent protein